MAATAHAATAHRLGKLAVTGGLDLALAPSHAFMVARHARAKSGKAFGEDGLPAELFRAAPVAVAEALAPAGVKAA
eukprot:11225722-Lingulodinium_polyedra.AAC.1